MTSASSNWLGSGDRSVVRALNSLSKGCGFESRQQRWENFLLLTLISVRRFQRAMKSYSHSFRIIYDKSAVVGSISGNSAE